MAPLIRLWVESIRVIHGWDWGPLEWLPRSSSVGYPMTSVPGCGRADHVLVGSLVFIYG